MDEKQKKQARLRKQRQRDKDRDINKENVTESVTLGERDIPSVTSFINGIEYVPASYVQGLSGRLYQSLPKRPRYLTLSDGQVLDRLNRPQARVLSGVEIQSIRASNEANYNYHPLKGELPSSLRARLS